MGVRPEVSVGGLTPEEEAMEAGLVAEGATAVAVAASCCCARA